MNTTPRKYYEAALDMPAGGGASTPSSKKLTPMTIEDVIKNKMTWEDVMKKYKPDISSDEANYILWNETCYPFDAETTLSHIHAYFTNNYQQ